VDGEISLADNNRCKKWVSMMNQQEDLQQLQLELNNLYGLQTENSDPLSRLEELLSQKINTMIQFDFAGLIRILYLIDVDENKLSLLLNGNSTEDSGLVLARLLIARQLEKIKSRKQYKSKNLNVDEDNW
jgi:hypothetical protein